MPSRAAVFVTAVCAIVGTVVATSTVRTPLCSSLMGPYCKYVRGSAGSR